MGVWSSGRRRSTANAFEKSHVGSNPTAPSIFIKYHFMYNIDIKTNEVVYLPLELSEATKTIGNFDNVKLVNSKYYGTTLNYTYHIFLVRT